MPGRAEQVSYVQTHLEAADFAAGLAMIAVLPASAAEPSGAGIHTPETVCLPAGSPAPQDKHAGVVLP